MADNLTEGDFAKHVGSKFLVNLDQQALELELVEVKSYLSSPTDQAGMERFSLFFRGPREIQLPQRSHVLNHESMGATEIFLVPIAVDDQGFRYEAVFNYFKK
jgi:hypothetical protein